MQLAVVKGYSQALQIWHSPSCCSAMDNMSGCFNDSSIMSIVAVCGSDFSCSMETSCMPSACQQLEKGAHERLAEPFRKMLCA